MILIYGRKCCYPGLKTLKMNQRLTTHGNYFTSIIKDLQISQFEELQLFVRWLGLESFKHAADFQQANAGNPRQIWVMIR